MCGGVSPFSSFDPCDPFCFLLAIKQTCYPQRHERHTKTAPRHADSRGDTQNGGACRYQPFRAEPSCVPVFCGLIPFATRGRSRENHERVMHALHAAMLSLPFSKASRSTFPFHRGSESGDSAFCARSAFSAKSAKSRQLQLPLPSCNITLLWDLPIKYDASMSRVKMSFLLVSKVLCVSVDSH